MFKKTKSYTYLKYSKKWGSHAHLKCAVSDSIRKIVKTKRSFFTKI